MYRLTVFLTVLVLVTAGCTSASDAGTADAAILTSTTFLADITRNIAGGRVSVESLLPAGADPHSYQPTPKDAARIADSKLIIVNGAGYEHFMEPLLENAGGEGEIIEASAGIDPGADAEGGGDGVDPHMWLDPNLVISYVENIRDALVNYDPDGTTAYRSNADAYINELRDLDAWIVRQVSQVPLERRLLVTNHEALGYFARRYGFTVTGTVVESFSSGASPSAGQMAGLIEQIETSGAPAIFLDASDNETLARQIAGETGVKVITDLHLESLTEGAPAGTYIDMMKQNVTMIVEALK